MTEDIQEQNTPNKRFLTVNDFANDNKARGLWPNTPAQVWGLRAASPGNGFGEAFVTVGRRVLVNELNFYKSIESIQREKWWVRKRK